MRIQLSLGLILVATVGATVVCCTDSGASKDAGVDSLSGCSRDSGATPQSGGGFCCPVLISATHACNGPPVGGWVPRADSCCPNRRPDMAYVASVDDGGCAVLVSDLDPQHACRSPPTFDAAEPADADAAGSDAGSATD
jgi:hypothetical protein